MTTASPLPHRPRGRRPAGAPSGRAALLTAATRAFAELGFERAD
ncbi:TetR/AcrR family transcriptional regulator, partial [Rhodopseudomonas palustris]